MSDLEHSNPVQNVGLNSYKISFDTRVYSQQAVKKAAYKFAANFAVVFELQGESTLAAYLSFAPEITSVDEEELIRAFLNEVVDQDLRETIAAETEQTRNLILAQAFSKTSLLQED